MRIQRQIFLLLRATLSGALVVLCIQQPNMSKFKKRRLLTQYLTYIFLAIIELYARRLLQKAMDFILKIKEGTMMGIGCR